VSEAEYRRLYAQQLAQINPQAVWSELHAMVAPNPPVLLCWEKAADRFCHRWLVAEWFRDHLGKHVPEINPRARTPSASGSPDASVQISFF
jgi:hypothetical protein